MRFECRRGCTKCCEQPGFVYLTESDVLHMAAYLDLSAEQFERKYVYRTKSLIRLRIARQARCSFLTADGCSVHAVKPLQCRAFPFWPELLESAKEWHKTAAYCPGIGQGELVNIAAAKVIAEEVREEYAAYYAR